MKDKKGNSRRGMSGRRILSVFFSLVLVLGLIPAMTFATAKEAQAATSNTIKVAGVNVYAPSGPAKYYVQSGNTITTTGASADNYNVIYDPTTHTLTLKDVNSPASAGSGSGSSSYITAYFSAYVGHDLTIVLEGDNVLGTTPTGSGSPGQGLYLRASSTVTFTGDGSLTTYARETGISSYSSTNVVLDGPELNIIARDAGSGSDVNGISGGTFTLNNGTLNVDAEATYGSSDARGVTTKFIQNGGSATIHTRGKGDHSYGFSASTYQQRAEWNGGDLTVDAGPYTQSNMGYNLAFNVYPAVNQTLMQQLISAGNVKYKNYSNGSEVTYSGVVGNVPMNTKPYISLSTPKFTVIYDPGTQGTWTADAETYSGLSPGANTPEFGTKSGATTNDHNPGYTFTGWEPTVDSTVTADVEYVAQWAANDNTPYKVEFYYQQANGSYPSTATASDDREGTTGATAEVTDNDINPTQENYILDEAAPNVFSGTVSAEEPYLVLKVYFKNQFTVSYAPGTQGTWAEADETYTGNSYGDPTPSFGTNSDATTSDSHNAGYHFTGWDPEPTDTVTGNATYTAQWEPNTNTPYTVEFYYQARGSYPDSPTSKVTDRTGTTDDTASVTDADKLPTEQGYVLDSTAANVLSGTIAGDGSLVLKVYFKQQFTVTYAPGTQGTWTTKSFPNQDYNATTPEPGIDPTADANHNPGYTFTGWSPERDATVTADANYVAQWAANINTKYKVEFYYQENGTYSATTTLYSERAGTTATTANVTNEDKVPTKDGYVLDEAAANVFSGTIAGDGSLVLKVYFKQQFTVTYYPGDHGTWSANDDKHEGNDYGAKTPPANADTDTAHDEGYSFAGWDPTWAATVSGNTDYVAQWTPNTNTPYTVEFYYQIEGAYVSDPDSSEERTGTTDTTAELGDADKTPTKDGYALDSEAPNVLSGNIAGDGSLVLKVYFKQQFTVSYAPGEHGSWTQEDETTSALNYNDVTPVLSTDPEVSHDPGYEFAGWEPEVADKVTADATYTALWKPAEDTAYTVEFYYQKDGKYPEVAEKVDNRTGTTDTEAKVTDEDKKPAKDGYEFDSDADNVLSGTIKGDGSLVLKVYFKETTKPEPEPDPKPEPEPEPEPEPAPVAPTTYTLTYDLNGGSYKGSTGPIVETHEEGSVVKIHEAPIREGYTFLYWKGSEYQPGDSYTVTGDHTFTAQWEKKAIEPTPVTPSDKDGGKTSPGKKSDTAPKTGDESRTGLLAIMLLAASLSLFMADRSRRRRAK